MLSQASDVSVIRQVFAANLNRFMRERSISRRKMCADLGIKYTTLCDWAKGHSSPKPETIETMSRYFGVTVSDFYIDTDRPSDPFMRLMKYSEGGTVMDMELLKELSEDQVKELLKKGFTFKHKTLEERAAEWGGELGLDGEFDWGEPVGREVW